ncbi:hypothetical protein Patl_3208 [Paraglaciecola sp. T6c]|uniref:hypothetical protein n=1 Tax=Pseudoalteromonas atlantica (strain T6c / ATCC BAA-1087) TaxID=3042615 RepID=UPI00005C5C98|nr:hypothetical protein [Paraglaciecola sp. T6c]ABG41714.1 hypothetical protein Patl_3208 [Paraglaciecola sp. T6c]
MKKEIYIHVGPPKTGTSALQQWLSNNRTFLETNSIYYPPHNVDVNGVSSGNVRNLYDLNEDKQLCLNTEGLEQILTEFEASACSILLLSSEFFFRRMDELKLRLPNVKFIAYLRNPLEVKESSYNQSVKRHFQLAPINATRGKRLPYMSRLVEFVQQHGRDSLKVRLYGSRYFKGGNIVSDLLFVLGVEQQVVLPIVNSSYQFEALEFKRWFNQFELEDYQVLVDRALQGYKEGTGDYSLITRKQYFEDSIYYSKVLANYAKELGGDVLAPLIKEMQNPSSKPYLKQVLSESDFLSVCSYLQRELGASFYLLTHEVNSIRHKDNERFHELFCNSYDKRYKLRFWLLKIRNGIKKYVSSSISILRR